MIEKINTSFWDNIAENAFYTYVTSFVMSTGEIVLFYMMIRNDIRKIVNSQLCNLQKTVDNPQRFRSIMKQVTDSINDLPEKDKYRYKLILDYIVKSKNIKELNELLKEFNIMSKVNLVYEEDYSKALINQSTFVSKGILFAVFLIVVFLFIYFKRTQLCTFRTNESGKIFGDDLGSKMTNPFNIMLPIVLTIIFIMFRNSIPEFEGLPVKSGFTGGIILSYICYGIVLKHFWSIDKYSHENTGSACRNNFSRINLWSSVIAFIFIAGYQGYFTKKVGLNRTPGDSYVFADFTKEVFPQLADIKINRKKKKKIDFIEKHTGFKTIEVELDC